MLAGATKSRPLGPVCLVGTCVGGGHVAEGNFLRLYCSQHLYQECSQPLAGLQLCQAVPSQAFQPSSAEAAPLLAQMHSEGCVGPQHIHSGVHVPRMQVALS